MGEGGQKIQTLNKEKKKSNSGQLVETEKASKLPWETSEP